MKVKRAAVIALLPLSVGAAPPADPGTAGLPDVIEAGRVAAQLSDWQTMTFWLVVLLVMATIERLVGGWHARATAAKLAAAIDRLSDADRLESIDLKVQLALVLDALGRLERKP